MIDQRESILQDDTFDDGVQPQLQHSTSRTVRWGDIHMYTFPNLLGDNPAVSDEGAPLTIGWNHEKMDVLDIDCYEVIRKHQPRRRRKDLIIPGPARDTYLLGMGYRLEELLIVAEEIRKIKKSRIASMRGTPWSKFKNVLGRNVRRFAPRPSAPSEPKIVCAKSG